MPREENLMHIKVTAPKDLWAGLMFIAFGAGFAIVAQNYSMGTAIRMGPAYFPTILGCLLALLGSILAIRGFSLEGTPVPRFHLRPVLVIVAAIVLFGMMLRPIGLVSAVLTLVVVSSFAGMGFGVVRVALLAIGLAVFSTLVFHYGLGLPFRLWPWE
jgi:hypothetical protein